MIHQALGVPPPTRNSRLLALEFAHTSAAVVAPPTPLLRHVPAAVPMISCSRAQKRCACHKGARTYPVIGRNHGSSRLQSRVINFLFRKKEKKEKKERAVKESTDVAIFSSLRQTAGVKKTKNVYRQQLMGYVAGCFSHFTQVLTLLVPVT